jgi:hypothetical protein
LGGYQHERIYLSCYWNVNIEKPYPIDSIHIEMIPDPFIDDVKYVNNKLNLGKEFKHKDSLTGCSYTHKIKITHIGSVMIEWVDITALVFSKLVTGIKLVIINDDAKKIINDTLILATEIKLRLNEKFGHVKCVDTYLADNTKCSICLKFIDNNTVSMKFDKNTVCENCLDKIDMSGYVERKFDIEETITDDSKIVFCI